MTTDLEQRLEKVLDEMEQASDEELASEMEEYRASLENCEFDGSRLGGVALEVAPSSTESSMTISATQISNLVDHLEIGEMRRFLSGIQYAAQVVKVSIRVGWNEFLKSLDEEAQQEPTDQPDKLITFDKKRFRLSGEEANADDGISPHSDELVA